MRWTAIVCAGLTLLTTLAAARGDDFRVVSRVFDGEGARPLSENTTLFRGSAVYDYLSDGSSVAVLDQSRGRFVLLDPKRQLRAEVSLAEVEAYCRELRGRSAGGKNALLKFAADPKFEVRVNDAIGSWEFQHKLMTYRLETAKAATPRAAAQYRDFCDAYAQLNVLVHPESLPPFPRMAVNRRLAERGLVPKEVKLTVPRLDGPTGKGLVRRSEHEIAWKLSDDDLKKIAATEKQRATFRAVGLEEYRASSPGQRVARAASGR